MHVSNPGVTPSNLPLGFPLVSFWAQRGTSWAPLDLFWGPRGSPSIRFGLHELSMDHHCFPSVYFGLTPRFVHRPFVPKPQF